ncbi:8263_t:CDS:2 [Dentiscutata erythropus]|uniref:Dihydropteridine reductase n=1 Tax=Dentiscutata erythropus TaxID=1348616 RepID=A0A9N9IDE3_9GLOM|nr:8263_t:CDS:2 [Dentiscutata erythropus]
MVAVTKKIQITSLLKTMNLRVLIYGGSGELGSALISLFKKHNWVVTSVGTRQNSEATYNIIVSNDDDLETQGKKVLTESSELLKEITVEKYDAILCVAGGFVMGNLTDKEFLKKSDLMIRKSLYSSLIASQLAAHHLKEDGFLMLTGAAGLRGTPGFIGYGVAKAGVHQLVKSLSAKGSGLPERARVVACLPSTIDTLSNRKAMPNADFSNFIPLETLTQRIFDWTTGVVHIEHGKLVEVIAKNSQTIFDEM